MRAFPEGWNPQRTAPQPGYRFLSAIEPLLSTDETPSNRFYEANPEKWLTVEHLNTIGCGITSRDRKEWTFRRALNVDDPYAPPPEEWTKEGWQMLGPDDLREQGDEVWIGQPLPAPLEWTKVRNGLGDPRHTARSNSYYYRRPIKASMTSIQSPSSNWRDIFRTPPTADECRRGILVAGYEDGPIFYNKPIDLNHWDRDYSHWQPATPFPGRPVKPTIIPPEVNGYKASYIRGGHIVAFGCAQIDLSLLRDAQYFFHGDFSDRKGNRTVSSIVLSSGVAISSKQIDKILDYVEVINKG